MKHKLAIMVFLAILVANWGGCWPCNTIVHKQFDETREVEVAPGKIVRIFEHNSIYTYGGNTHGYLINPEITKKSQYDLCFEYMGAVYIWKDVAIPITLRIFRDCFYIIGFDRETDFYKMNFRYYRSRDDGTFVEIDRQEFPKSIAIQNLWMDASDKVLLKAMDPKEYWFRVSYTCKIWLHLEGGIPFYQNKEPSEDFVDEYIKKYIQ